MASASLYKPSGPSHKSQETAEVLFGTLKGPRGTRMGLATIPLHTHHTKAHSCLLALDYFCKSPSQLSLSQDDME